MLAVRNFFYTLLCLFAFTSLKAQTDDLMIVEFVDWQGGSGWAVKIYNPTDQTINLSDYKITRYRDGDVNINAQADINGTLLPGQHKIFGNSEYNSNCPSNTNEVSGIIGTNEEDAIALTKENNNENVDMVGAWGTATSITIDGFNNFDALWQHKITRNQDNCIRYTDLAGTSTNSWPNNSSTNVTTWEVFPHSCLSNTNFTFQTPNLNIYEDTTLCEREELNLNYFSLGFETYEWLGQNNNTPSITITDAGTYTLEVTTENLCKAQDEIIVDYKICDSTITPPPPPPPVVVKDTFVVPNIITPNGDKINDKFVISGLDTSVVTLTIYNRWGKSVYEQIDYKNDWEAEGISDGTYFFKIQYDAIEQKGWVEVKR